MTNKFVSRVWTMRCAACYAVTHEDLKCRSALSSAASWESKRCPGPSATSVFDPHPRFFHSILKGSFHNNICSWLTSANKMQAGFMSYLLLNPNSATPHLKITLIFSFDFGGQPTESSGFFRIRMGCVGSELLERAVS